MEKARIYELAKELNTTSKRLMEKLSEINVNVKNHMSLLEPHELDALYKHIGVIKHDEKKQNTEKKIEDEKKVVVDNTHTTEKKKDIKSAPRIIRTTEIIIDSKNETNNSETTTTTTTTTNYPKKDTKNVAKPSYRNDYMKSESNTSGLRPGFIRDSKPDFKNKQSNRNNSVVDPQNITSRAPSIQQDEILIIKQNLKNEEINKEDKTVADNIQTEVKIIKNIEPIDAAKTINKETVVEKVESKIVEQGGVTAPVNQEQAPNNDATVAKKADEPVTTDNKVNVENRPQGQYNNGPRTDRPQGQYNNGPRTDRPQGQYNNGPRTDRPQGQYNNGPRTDRPQGQYNNGPRTDRPQGQYNNGPRPDRPQGQYNNNQGTDRTQGQYNNGPRPDRPQGQYNNGPRPDRPQGSYNNGPRTDRPQGSYNNQGSDRPQGSYNNGPRQDRPQGSYNNGPRPQGQGSYNNGPRPQGQGSYNNGPRPQGQGSYNNGPRPQGQGSYNNGPRNDRPQGQYNNGPRNDRPQGQYNNNRSQGLEIPKPDAAVAQDQFDSQRNEQRREFQSKDFDKSAKRDENKKKEAPKTTIIQNKTRVRPQKIVIEKKGVSEILSEDYIFSEFYNDDGKKKRFPKNRRNEKAQVKYIPPKAVLTSITIPESLTVKELAEALKKTSTEIIKKLMVYGVMATLNNDVDFQTATVIAEEYGVKTEKAIQVSEEDILFDDVEIVDETKLQPRPPVVVVMGHVDHGKTSLLDAIRSARVMDTEAGGITQHIGAYTVTINDRDITFLDTPGHEAFTAMRARGAQATDIAILVVAADDGVMPQTIEAINHAKAANVSIIVAINKIDKPGANPDKVKQELTEYGIVAEEWGGDAIMVPVSAKKRENIDQLLEMVLLAADMLELKADPDRQAKGTVIEAKLDKERGPVASILVQRGTLKIGDAIIAGSAFGRIKAMTNDKGLSIKTAGPSTPVEILGMTDVPEAGELFYAVTDEKVAKQLVEKRKFENKVKHYKASAKVTLEDLYAQIIAGKVKDLNIIVKADVQGSVEAVKQSLLKLSDGEVRVNIVHDAVGAITESDVTLAEVSNAIIIGFNIRPSIVVTEAAKNAGVDLRLYSVIYKAIEDVQAAMKGMLEPTFKEVVLGHIEIRQIFKVSDIGTIGGAYVTDGKVQRNSEVRVVRGGIVVHEGKLASLKRFKDDVKEVATGYECGVSIERFNDIKEGDIIEAFVMEEVKR